MFHKILVALDQSDLSHQVFEAALTLAKQLDGHLMLVHVLSPVETNFTSPIFSMPGTYPLLREDVDFYLQQWRTKETEGLEFLRLKTEIATTAGIPTEFTQMLGDPGHAICTIAKTWDANLILIGRRGYTGIGELFMGSISNYVLHHAPCSVLAIQGKLDSEPVVDPEPSVYATA